MFAQHGEMVLSEHANHTKRCEEGCVIFRGMQNIFSERTVRC